MTTRTTMALRHAPGLARAVGLALALIGPAAARAEAPPVFIPSPVEPSRRGAVAAVRPAAGSALRVIVGDGHPPFAVTGPDGAPGGFDVDLARALCEALAASCTVQARRFDTVLDALEEGRGDLALAALRVDGPARGGVAYGTPYLRTPARFLARRDGAGLPATLAGGGEEPSPAALAGVEVGVVAGSAHEAFLAAAFPGAARRPYATPPAALDALAGGRVAILFGDAIAMALWVEGRAGEAYGFRGGPYLESTYFGEGLAVATRRDDLGLRRALDEALRRVAASGRYAEIYLRRFPVPIY